MSLIAFKDLSLARGTTLFAGLNLSIAKGDRLGLVAANGRGKTSLLNILVGVDEATTGDVTRARGLVVALAPQEPPQHLFALSLHDAVRDALDAETAETESWRVDILLDDLAVDEPLRGRAVRDLSGGWQRVMLLARAAVTEPDLLLLDEPTNHLDIGRIGVPIHVHTRDTCGAVIATILEASNSGVNAAMDALSGDTSQPMPDFIVEALRHTDRDTGFGMGLHERWHEMDFTPCRLGSRSHRRTMLVSPASVR